MDRVIMEESRILTDRLTDAVAVLVGRLLEDADVTLLEPRHCTAFPVTILNVCQEPIGLSHCQD